MRNFKDLIEARGDTAVFTLGRFNPPTTGHEKLIKKMVLELFFRLTRIFLKTTNLEIPIWKKCFGTIVT